MFENHLRMYRKYWFNFIGRQKHINLVTQSHSVYKLKFTFLSASPKYLYAVKYSLLAYVMHVFNMRSISWSFNFKKVIVIPTYFLVLTHTECIAIGP
jgi:hypothetical protein